MGWLTAINAGFLVEFSTCGVGPLDEGHEATIFLMWP